MRQSPRRDHAIAVGCGGALFGAGFLALITLGSWAGLAAPNSNLFEQRWFEAVFALVALVFFVGMYILVNPWTGWPMPPVRSEPWRPWRFLARALQYRLVISITRSRGDSYAPAAPPESDHESESAMTIPSTASPAFRRDSPRRRTTPSPSTDDLDAEQIELLCQLVAGYRNAPRAARNDLFRCRPATEPIGFGPTSEPPGVYIVSHAGLPEGMLVSRHDLQMLARGKCIKTYPPPLSVMLTTPVAIGSFEIEPAGFDLTDKS